jgi:hypothetical protein
MTQLDERIHAAFEARADEIPPVAPPLELQPSRRRSGSAARGGDRLRLASARWWLPPLVAALAVVVVVLGALAVGRAMPGTPSKPALPAASAPIQTSVPPYYVAIITDRPLSGYGLPASVATVRDTATGKVLATVRPPSPYTGFSQVSGATDDRTFVLLANTRPAFGTANMERFYLLRISPSAASAAGRASLTALPASFISGGNDVTTMALSPDGRALAAILTPSPPSANSLPEASLSVFYLATGSTRTWLRYVCHQHKCQQNEFGSGDPNSTLPVTLTWAQNGKSLAFTPGPAITQLRLLDLHASGDNAQANSKPFPIHGVPVAFWNSAVMTPDTKSAFISYAGSHGQSVFGGLVWYSAKTGKLTTINMLTFTNEGHNTGYGRDPDDVVWTSYNGSQAIVLDARPGQTAGVYTGTSYTPLPWPADVLDVAW